MCCARPLEDRAVGRTEKCFQTCDNHYTTRTVASLFLIDASSSSEAASDASSEDAPHNMLHVGRLIYPFRNTRVEDAQGRVQGCNHFTRDARSRESSALEAGDSSTIIGGT